MQLSKITKPKEPLALSEARGLLCVDSIPVVNDLPHPTDGRELGQQRMR